MDRILIIAIRVRRALLRSDVDSPATRYVEQGSCLPDPLNLAYATSLIGAACCPLRFLVTATATENIQMKPRYLVMGIKKFAGYATRLREESSPVSAMSIPKATSHRGRSRMK